MTIARRAAFLPALLSLSGCAVSRDMAREDIFVLHSVREQRAAEAGGCASARTGFQPFPADADRFFSFWAVKVQAETGRIVRLKSKQAGELRGCFGPTADPARQNFHAEIRLGTITARGSGECLALQINKPEAGLFPVRCQLVLADLAPPYSGGVLTTNTMTSRALFGEASDPPGYTQASIATIRLWRKIATSARKPAGSGNTSPSSFR